VRKWKRSPCDPYSPRTRSRTSSSQRGADAVEILAPVRNSHGHSKTLFDWSLPPPLHSQSELRVATMEDEPHCWGPSSSEGPLKRDYQMFSVWHRLLQEASTLGWRFFLMIKACVIWRYNPKEIWMNAEAMAKEASARYIDEDQGRNRPKEERTT
jgi:hypothetical protein